MPDDSNPLHDVNGFQRDALVVIASCDEPPRGVTIRDELEEYYGHSVNVGRLYPNLNRLEDDGLLDKVPVDNQAKEYTLTEEGERVVSILSEWVQERTSDIDCNEASASPV